MGEMVSKLLVIGPGYNIFDTDIKYSIPLYQRAFAWEDKQLIQLIEDISDVPDDEHYYIGALIVSRQGDKFEVVDGQQRLTSLYLLLNCLGVDVKDTLTFACRDKSNYTLKKIKELLQDNRSKLDMERIESSIQRGLSILVEELNRSGYDKADLINKLKRVVLYRIEVPENTDLNRYFEIMNTRGEQLEQHDILKAKLMRFLPDADKAVFAGIWDACSDMTGYVQMHFVSQNNAVRNKLFGGEWGNMPPDNWDDYRSSMQASSAEGINRIINDIIDVNFEVDSNDGYSDDDNRVRFESIIEFPYFLIHTLKVLIEIKGIRHENGSSLNDATPLDDKKLVDCFDRVIKYGTTEKERISDNRAWFSKEFIICLLRTRYLFDKYIIKREFANENSEGEWSLKSLKASGKQTKKRPYYKNTEFARPYDREKAKELRTKTNTMLQSALRVSYTSPKAMHWITQLLLWLSANNYKHSVLSPDDMADCYSKATEAIAKKAVTEDFFNKCNKGVFAMGVNTPHIVFNYLDFLLWKNNRTDYDGFVFEFRNSVEHWYPRNPSEGTFEPWKDGVDQFGNLCIIQRNVNSKFSNMSPEAKKSTFADMISKGSLKLRIMSSLTEKNGSKSASLYWKETKYREHEDKMIRILRDACMIGENSNSVC